jgi:hypothetical protein
MDPDFQADIDRRMLHLLEVNDIRYETLTGSVDDRMDALLQAVER